MRIRTLSFYTSLVIAPSVVFASDYDHDLDALMSMSLEDLSMLEVNVTSASKREQHISEIPAAIYVISNERIVRSGAKTIADALSLAPGIEVSQFNESSDFVSSRGFHDGLFNKMLVMIDGRSVFSPMYGGAFWEDIDYILADIERIEIIRGPAGTIWGGNAVNGVINIITKSTKDTLGSYGQIAYGQHGYQEISARHGLQFNENTTARAFYKAKDTFTVIDEYQNQYENDKVNTISTQTAGVKFDIEDGNTSWMLAFGGEKSDQYYDWFTVDMSQASIIKKETYRDVESSSFYGQINHHAQYEKSEWQTNLWYWNDTDNSPDANGQFTTVDVDTVITTTINQSVTVLFGGGIRYTDIQLQDSNDFSFQEIDSYNRYSYEPNSYDTITNLYSQLDIKITNKLFAQIGIKGEYFTLNDTLEISPQLRAIYSLTEKQKLWFGIGRAVISPSYFEQKSTYYSVYLTEYDDYKYPDGLDVFSPNANLNNESVITVDVGYRYESNQINIDTTAYISKYENIRGTDYVGYEIDLNGYEHLFYESNDDYEAKTYGAEVAIEWDINQSLKNYMSYSYLSFSQERVKGNLDAPDYDDYYEIEHQNLISNQLLWQVTDTIQWDFVLNYKNINYKDSYVDVDDLLSLNTRLGWQKHEHAPLIEVMIKNIGMSSKCELETYTDNNLCRGYETEQSIYGRVSYEF